MNEELRAKAEVARDLIARGAKEVSITGTDIKVVSAQPGQYVQGATTQIVNVQVQASAQSSVALALRFSFARIELRELYKNSEKLPEIEKHLLLLERELAKQKPSKTVLKQILGWALNFGWDVFCKLAPIIIDRIMAGS